MKTTIALLSTPGLERPYDKSRPLEIVEADLAEPQSGELLIKMVAAGLCHSDLSAINGDIPQSHKVALGHEGSGIVEAVGPNVTRFKVGDHVVMVFLPSCGHCVPCAEGRPSICEPGMVANAKGELITGGRRISYKGETINHFLGVSAFSTYIVAAEDSCVKIDQSIPLVHAGLLGCAALTGAGAVINAGEIRPSESCAVVGLGGVGLTAILAAVASGAREIIAVDIAPDKLEFARKLGAHHTINSAEPDALEKLKTLTNGGVDISVEIAGNIKALEFAYNATHRGGRTITAGMPNPKAELKIGAAAMTITEKMIRGSFVGSCVPTRDIPRFAQMMVQGQLPMEKLMTHQIKLEEINEGFERLASGQAIRQVIVFD